MTVDVRPFPRPDWSPLPYEGCVGVDGKLLTREGDFFIAMLRFQEHATIHEHPGAADTIVICLEGSGSRRSPARRCRSRPESRCAGQRASCTSSGRRTRTMKTLMVEGWAAR